MMALQASSNPEGQEAAARLDDGERLRAAGVIQRNFRGHRARREMQGCSLDPSTRWMEAVKDAQYQKLTKPTAPAPSDGTKAQSSSARMNWLRATKIAERAGAYDSSGSATDGSEDAEVSEKEAKDQQLSKEERQKRHQRRVQARAKNSKMMDLQYFLELVDQKHRYGSSLRKYHNYWKTQDTKQNFFYWLDEGDGKKVELPECSRERLDREQVRYLSREERLKYLVNIDKDGLLVWAKNGEKVWTKDELYKDSIDGIVPITSSTPAFKYNIAPKVVESGMASSESDAESDEDSEEGDEGTRYVNEDFHRAKGPAKIKYVNSAVIFNHLIRSSMRKGHKWIFVADTSFRLYVGYKQSGAFQHSSFMHGSRIAAAGLIKIKHGQLRKLSPLSGHYRPRVENFRSFVYNLRDQGVDTSRVSISRSYAVLAGLESYMKTTGKIKSVGKEAKYKKDKLLHPDKVRQEEEAKKDKSQSAEKERQHLAAVMAEQENANKSKKSLSGRFSRVIGLFKERKDAAMESADGSSRGPEGPEDGIPAPEGKR